MLAAAFLGMADELKRGSGGEEAPIDREEYARAMETLAAATALSVLSAYYSGRLAWQSHSFNDVSTGTDATPLWIPQLSMVIGTTVLAIAFADELVLELRGRRGTTDVASRNE